MVIATRKTDYIFWGWCTKSASLFINPWIRHMGILKELLRRPIYPLRGSQFMLLNLNWHNNKKWCLLLRNSSKVRHFTICAIKNSDAAVIHITIESISCFNLISSYTITSLVWRNTGKKGYSVLIYIEIDAERATTILHLKGYCWLVSSISKDCLYPFI